MKTINTLITILGLSFSQISANTLLGPGTCDDGEPCAFKCNTTNACSRGILTCPAGQVCVIQCTKPDSCHRARIHGHNAAIFQVQCTAESACNDIQIYGEKAPTVSVQCTGEDACYGAYIKIPRRKNQYSKDEIELQCVAKDACENARIDARFASSDQSITVWCTAPDACEGVSVRKGFADYECKGDGCHYFTTDIFMDDIIDTTDMPLDDGELNSGMAVDNNELIDDGELLYSTDVPSDDDDISRADCYDTTSNNPCTRSHIEDNKMYFASCTSCCNFIQCDQYGAAYDKKCGDNAFWYDSIKACAINTGQCGDRGC